MKSRALLLASLALASCAVGADGKFGGGRVVLRADQRPRTERPEEPSAPPAEITANAKPEGRVVAPTAASPTDDRLPAPETATAHVPTVWPFHVHSYSIDLTIDPASHGIRGTTTIDVEDRTDGIAELTFDAVDLSIEAVGGGDGSSLRPLNFTYDGRTLHVPLATTSRTGTMRVFFIRYSGHPARGIYFNDGPHPQVYTQGECEDSRYWFPCHDEPDDRARHSLSVHTPDGWRVVARGAEFDQTIGGNQLGGGFELDVPHAAYLTSMVAGDYEEIRETGVVPLEFVVEKRDAPYAAFDFRKTDQVLRFFGDYTGLPYPYPKYSQTCVRHFMFGGMENISATTLTDHTIHPPEWEPARTSTSLIAHEAAHQWFGDWITCADWSHCWLNEGFATYFDALFTEHDEGRDAFLWALRGIRHGALEAMDHERRAMISNKYVTPMDLFNGHAYPGGAARLHMLRHLLGDDAFREAIRHYVKTCGLKCVTTDDFEKAVSESCGQDLKWFFDQWFRKPGYPKLKIRWKWDEAKHAEIVTVEQTQKAEGGVPEAYRLPLDIEFSRFGSSTDEGTTTRRVELTKRSESFEIALPFEAKGVQVDPETALLARFDLDRASGVHAMTMFGGSNPSWRADSAEALAEVAKDEKLTWMARDNAHAVIVTNFQNRDFSWLPVSMRFAAFRASLAAQVASIKGYDAAKALVRAMKPDEDLRVRIAAADALAGFGSGPMATEALPGYLHDSLAAYLDDTNDLMRAAAVSGIAKLKAPNAFDTLLAQVERPGWQSVVRVAALRGFAELGDERAFATLVRFAAPGDDWARGAALDSLGRMGRARPEYRDAVLPYLDDPERTVRHAAAEALGKIADPDVIETLVAHFKTETWPACREALRNAIKACRGAAVEEGRLVSVEAVRGAELRERHAALRDEADALAKSLATLAGDAKTTAETRLKSLKDQMAQLQRDLGALGVPVKPPPKPVAK